MIFSPISERILLGILVNEAKKLNNNESAVPFLADVAAGCLRDVSCFFYLTHQSKQIMFLSIMKTDVALLKYFERNFMLIL